ncbi:hypothetical protein BDR04DRAFT_1143939 [Suillus decipiens]|nr:hypothetical protein BDR04DRAFT_1143939 [Suillus decipiens]
MEDSSGNIAAARSLQFCADMYVSIATLWCYDYMCLLHEEWTYLLRSDWSKVKGLYIITRYLPFIYLVTVLLEYLTPNQNPGRCWVLADLKSCLGISLVSFSEFFFVLRTYVLWNKNRILLAAMFSTSFVSSQSTHYTKASGRCISQAFFVVSLAFAITDSVPAAYVTSAIPGIPGCYRSSTSSGLFIPFLLLTVFELGLVILTLIRAIQSWRTSSSRLYVVFVKHNIFYYACGLILSVANILASLLLQYSYYHMLYVFEVVILAILATRMHLHLWHANRRAHDTGDPMHITMSDMSSMNFAVS